MALRARHRRPLLGARRHRPVRRSCSPSRPAARSSWWPRTEELRFTEMCAARGLPGPPHRRRRLRARSRTPGFEAGTQVLAVLRPVHGDPRRAARGARADPAERPAGVSGRARPAARGRRPSWPTMRPDRRPSARPRRRRSRRPRRPRRAGARSQRRGAHPAVRRRPGHRGHDAPARHPVGGRRDRRADLAGARRRAALVGGGGGGRLRASQRCALGPGAVASPRRDG